MREEDSNWFARWEEDLPTQEELMPLSQTLITPDLALAFDIRSSDGTQVPAAAAPPPPSSQPTSGEFDSGDMGSGGGGGDEPARTLKRPRLVWTPQLHKRFVDAVAHLGIKNAVPKTIMQLMSVDGLTRENVASHLQKYRLYLKRVQGLSASGAAAGGALAAAADPTADHLFSSSPVPAHFFHAAAGRPNSSDHYMPFVPVNALQQHHHQMAVAAATASGHHPQLQPPYHQPHYGSPPAEQFEHPFAPRQSQGVVHRVGGGGAVVHNSVPTSYMDDVESTAAMGGRKVLTLFPAGDD